MFDRIAFVIGEAVQGIRRNVSMAFMAVVVVATSLWLVGVFGFAYVRALDEAKNIPGKFEMYVQLREGTSMQGIQDTVRIIRSVSGVSEVNWIPKDKAWERYKKQNPTQDFSFENPLPDALKVRLEDLGKGDSVAEQIQALPAVQEKGVVYDSASQNFVQRMLRMLEMLGSIGGLLLLVAGILIYNTIRLAAIARQTEIRIMRLVGASRATILVPFLLEGMIAGTLGGFVSASFVFATIRYVVSEYDRIQGATELVGVMNPDAVARSTNAFVSPTVGTIFMILTGLGATFGLLCSLLAIRFRPEVR